MIRLKVVVLFVKVGVKHLCVFINKADMVDDEEILELVSDTFSYHFALVSITGLIYTIFGI